jgi:hypothetical protein
MITVLLTWFKTGRRWMQPGEAAKSPAAHRLVRLMNCLRLMRGGSWVSIICFLLEFASARHYAKGAETETRPRQH